MKKILVAVVAVAFALTTASLLVAEETKSAPTNAPAVTKPATTPTAAPVVAPAAPVVAKTDVKADCLKKFPGKTEKDAEIANCLKGTTTTTTTAKAEVAKPVEKKVEAAKPAAPTTK